MNDHQPPPKSWRKYAPCGCVLLMVIVLILLPALGWMVWSANAVRLVENELAKIRDAKEPLEPADLNAFYAIPAGRTDATQLWVEVGETFADTAFNKAAGAFPIVGDGPEIPPSGEDWEQLRAVEELLERYSDEMAKIHEAARLGGSARFERDFEDAFAITLHPIQGLRSAGRMLSLEARVAGHRGDAAAVARSIHAIFAVCRAVEEDPLLLPHLVHVALVGTAVNELEVAVGSVEFSDGDLRMLQEDVRSVNIRRGLERSLMGERVFGIHAFRNPQAGFADLGMALPLHANNEDLALYLSMCARYVDASRHPFPEALTLSEEASAEVAQVDGGSPINNLRYAYTRMILPSVETVFEASARGTGTIACADTSIAIEQYRRRHGELPNTLAELVPEFLNAVPLDPMDGKPLRYIVNDGGYVLYSIGQNRVDDGGVLGDERLDEAFSVRIKAMNQSANSNK